VRLSCARKNTTPRWDTAVCQFSGYRRFCKRHTGDGKVADQGIGVLSIEDIVDHVHVGVFTSNDRSAFNMFESIKCS
jgi:hypothetical protein